MRAKRKGDERGDRKFKILLQQCREMQRELGLGRPVVVGMEKRGQI